MDHSPQRSSAVTEYNRIAELLKGSKEVVKTLKDERQSEEPMPFVVLENSSGTGKTQMAFNLEAQGDFDVFYLLTHCVLKDLWNPCPIFGQAILRDRHFYSPLVFMDAMTLFGPSYFEGHHFKSPLGIASIHVYMVSQFLTFATAVIMTTMNQEMEDLLASCDLVTPLILDTNPDLEDTIMTPKSRSDRKNQTNVDPDNKLEKERKRCSNYRQRQRNEREHLKQEEKLLMAKLAAIQEARKESELSSTSVWKLFAQNQLEARLNAETKQRRLCQAIAARASYIREFQELSQRRIEGDAGLAVDDLLTDSEAASTIPFCQLYVQDLDGVHAQTEDCLRGFNEFSSVKTWEEDNETGSIQFMERQELLCDFEQACQTLWDAAQLRHRQECRREFHQVPDPDRTSAFNFRVSTRLSSGLVVSALQRVVSRRYRTRDRFVYVWQSYMDGEGMFAGLNAGETGWVVLTRSVDTCGLEKVTRTTVIWHTSTDIDNAVIPETVAKEFTTMTIGSVTEDVDEITKRFQEVNIVV